MLNRKTTLFVIFSLIFIVISSLIIQNLDTFNPFNFLERQKASRLTSFYFWTKEDPLLTGPDFDGDKFTQTISLLEENQQALMKTYHLNKSFIPTKFLSSLPKVTKAEKVFLNSPSLENAQTLITAYKATVYLYKQDIEDKNILFNSFFQNRNKQANIIYVDVSSTPQIILDAHQKILKNAQKLQEEIGKREKCLFGKGGCLKPSIRFVPPDKTNQTAKIQKKNILPLDVLFSEVDQPKSSDILRGPYQVETACFGLNDDLSAPQRPFYIIETNTKSLFFEKMPYLFMKLADENYYRKLRPERFEEQLLVDKGLKRILQSETLAYKCPDLTYQPKLSTINHLTKLIKTEPLFLLLETTGISVIDDLIAQGKDLEKTILDSEIPIFEQIKKLSKLYLYFYSKSKKDDFLQRGLLGDRLLVDYPILLNNLVLELSNLKVEEILNNSQPAGDNFLFLFATRSAPILTYLTFSKSFWRLDDQPTFIQNKIVNQAGLDFRYIKYSQAINYFSKEEILSWSKDKNYYNLLKKLYDERTK